MWCAKDVGTNGFGRTKPGVPHIHAHVGGGRSLAHRDPAMDVLVSRAGGQLGHGRWKRTEEKKKNPLRQFETTLPPPPPPVKCYIS